MLAYGAARALARTRAEVTHGVFLVPGGLVLHYQLLQSKCCQVGGWKAAGTAVPSSVREQEG